ncbi:hypothetical protein SAMN05216421_1176 [Halopseudomonas xinjiangensis]|uniref:Uncharacterized protein n=1 Tax=Halopseudomonas xinjiangensis TaxID=487184 RepID=A0A1H1QMV2_9GAMM|nr:hypothetical protein SAMN05216421_1176 [Halopseudomonas xinjiangensis]
MSDVPCLNCGACCATFRVSFYWGETDAAPEGSIPSHLTEQVNHYYSCMQGTNQPSPRCVALLGSIGDGVRCSIYDKRSSACRDFSYHGEKRSGQPDLSARKGHSRPAPAAFRSTGAGADPDHRRLTRHPALP